jgi:hypothetical protein
MALVVCFFVYIVQGLFGALYVGEVEQQFKAAYVQTSVEYFVF